MAFPLCFACKHANNIPTSPSAKKCVMRRSGLDQCSGSLADLASSEKVLDLVEEMLSLNEEHDRLLDVQDIEPDPENELYGGKKARMILITKTGRAFQITVEALLCRRCNLPRTISSDHEPGCTWHPSKRATVL
jgi:hypothetical protein